METEKKSSFIGWPDLWVLNEFIDLETWDNHDPNALGKRVYPLAYVDLVSEEWDEDYDEDEVEGYRGYAYYLNLHVPADKLDTLTAVMEANDWTVETDQSEIIDGWYEDVDLCKSIWKEYPNANEEEAD